MWKFDKFETKRVQACAHGRVRVACVLLKIIKIKNVYTHTPVYHFVPRATLIARVVRINGHSVALRGFGRQSQKSEDDDKDILSAKNTRRGKKFGKNDVRNKRKNRDELNLKEILEKYAKPDKNQSARRVSFEIIENLDLRPRLIDSLETVRELPQYKKLVRGDELQGDDMFWRESYYFESSDDEETNKKSYKSRRWGRRYSDSETETETESDSSEQYSDKPTQEKANDFKIKSPCNSSQISAIKTVIDNLTSKNVSTTVVHGPPGTGKTTCIVELIHQLNKLDKTVLVCSLTHKAVDNVMDKFIKFQENYDTGMGQRTISKIARIQPKGFDKNSQKYNIDKFLDEKKENITPIIDELTEKLRETNLEMHLKSNFYKDKLESGDQDSKERTMELINKRVMIEVLEQKKNISKKAAKKYSNITTKINVVFSTLHAISGQPFIFNQKFKKKKDIPFVLSKILKINDHPTRPNFDVIIIDEAGQNFDIDCWGAISRGQDLVLVGDNQQLSSFSPDSSSYECFKVNGAMSIMDRAVKVSRSYPNTDRVACTWLSTQYRFNEQIMKWPNSAIYESRLSAGSNNANIQYKNIRPVLIFNTLESKESFGSEMSYCNEIEGKLLIKYLDRLIYKYGDELKMEEVGIIVTYAAQKRFLLSF